MTRKPPNSRPRRLFLIATPLLAVLATLACLELALALFFPTPFSLEHNMYFEPDPHTGYRLKPNTTGQYGTIEARANSRGHRDDEIEIARRPGSRRILAIGDSFTLGTRVHQHEAYPQRLEVLLNQPGETLTEVVNAGVGGWDTFHYAQYYEHRGRQLSPDLVLVGYFVGNDVYAQATSLEELRTAVLGRRVTRESARSLSLSPKVLLYENSHLARLVLNRGPRIMGLPVREDCSDFPKWYRSYQASRMGYHRVRDRNRDHRVDASIDHLDRLRRLAETDGARLVVVLLPDENQINPTLQASIIPAEKRDRYDFRMPQTLVEERLAAIGVPTIDLQDAFRDDPRCLYMNDTHWTPEGHALAAATIHRALRERGLLPPAR